MARSQRRRQANLGYVFACQSYPFAAHGAAHDCRAGRQRCGVREKWDGLRLVNAFRHNSSLPSRRLGLLRQPFGYSTFPLTAWLFIAEQPLLSKVSVDSMV